MMYHQKRHNFIALEIQTNLVNGVNKAWDSGNIVLLNKYFDTLSMHMAIDLI